MTFKYYLEFTDLIEALRIIKKGNTINNDEVKIGKFQGREVFKTNHLNDLRGGNTRDDSLSNKDIMDIIYKIPTSNKLIPNKYYSIVYKSNNKYNMVVLYIDDNNIRIVTIIQQFRNNDTYKVKDGDIKFVVESQSMEIISLTSV